MKQISLHTTKDETLKILQTYVDRIRPPYGGKVTGDLFQISLAERHTRSHWRNGTALTYVLAGTVQQKNGESTVSYHIIPGVMNLIIACCLFLGLLCSIYHLLSGANNGFVVVILSCAFVLFFLWNIWEARQCAKEFEQILLPKTE